MNERLSTLQNENKKNSERSPTHHDNVILKLHVTWLSVLRLV